MHQLRVCKVYNASVTEGKAFIEFHKAFGAVELEADTTGRAYLTREATSQMTSLPSTAEVENEVTRPGAPPTGCRLEMAFWCLVESVVSLEVVPRSTFCCHM